MRPTTITLSFLTDLQSSLISVPSVEGGGLHISYVIGGVLTILAILILIAALIIYRSVRCFFIFLAPGLKTEGTPSFDTQHKVQIKSK